MPADRGRTPQARPLYIRLEPELRRRVDAYTLEHGLTTTEFGQVAVAWYLDFHEGTAPEETSC